MAILHSSTSLWSQNASEIGVSSRKQAAAPLLKKTQNVRDVDQEAYSKMLLIRRFEERVAQLYGMGLIGGFCHLYIGQEAVVVGVQLALKEGDQIITSYRDHGHMLACDMSPDGVMAELAGRIGGFSKGKGGSMHMFSKEQGFYGGHGIVGAQIPLGTGMAFANKYRGNDNVAIVYLGDGAANQGQFFESMNMASLWKLPVIYVIENNHYAMGTSVARSTRGSDFSKRGAPFDLPGAQVDGMDVRAVHAAADQAIQRARSGEGPYLLDVQTYRYRGHSMSDPAKYRTKEEVEKIRANADPITNSRERLIAAGRMSAEDADAIDAALKKRVAEAVEFAKTSPEPDPSELWTDVLLPSSQEGGASWS